MSKLTLPTLTAALFIGQAAQAAEVTFEGYYRARARAFHSLSLNNELGAASEGASNFFQHRLILGPRIYMNDNVGVFIDLRALDGVNWGHQAQPVFDPVAGEDISRIFTHDMTAPVSDQDDTTPLDDITLWRAWGEVHGAAGRFSFGRQPLHWGSGIWLNDGMGEFGEYGDSADRVAWEYLIQDKVYLMTAFDLNQEGFVNERDDSTSYNLAAAYRSETVVSGLLMQYRRVPDPRFNLFSFDGQMDAELGRLEVHLEAVGQFGSGDLENGANEVTLAAVGTVLDAGLNFDAWQLGVQGGIATGDGDPSDNRLRTFTFDRDFNVGLILFEQPMPTLAASAGSELNQNRSFEATLTGNALSNAMYLKPRITRKLFDDKLEIEGAFLTARTAKLPELSQGRNGYGNEIDLTTRYLPFEHVTFTAAFGALLPGPFFRNYIDPDNDAFRNFDDPVLTGQLSTRIDF